MRHRNKSNALGWLLLSAAIVGVDQWSKAWVLRSLPEYTAVPVVPGFWNWFRTYNEGAAFSFLSDAGGWQKYLFMLLAVGISIGLTVALARMPRGAWKTAAPYALVIGGATGNVIDRLVHGHVVDFIQWYVGKHYWPSFNVADAAICVGVVAIFLAGLLPQRQARHGLGR
ncbi:lipoprotein signal peptidase [Lysobacter sp. TY2-98]|uniref:signal peptidase II n=1 Tax=Lysobacter sp. TY2-98 TaxID=2290922 RepID=UPI000E2033E8|nr:signal peptidase II [Lysobacter sp. TY2-98]AXK71994.1 lipoprotein signal peptidase [Lysobacter sp. TY2-98]